MRTWKKSPVVRVGGVQVTERERQVWKWFSLSETTRGIAGLLDISPKTVEFHRSKLYRKLGVNDYAALARLAIRHGLISA